ncbi:radical SAM family heme chaperone HemW [Rubeoparvulum massiliense]|uniref:radical SAM family heme chaperone HemW n=1 Tax=Rubeoparvulum massiliense TaxID=1631346 RepID=UPI00065E3542|nr:radical SAM family heme chaperone HemW [Rubeoparvulum massiliense]
MKVEACYIHIPFCPHKCYYCDFNIFVMQQDKYVDQYLDALEQEMLLRFSTGKVRLHTLYVGGGTPTALSLDQLGRLMEMVHRFLILDDDHGEFTVEANPGTLDPMKLQLLHDAGVNRLSIGAQTMDREILKRIGRLHQPEDVVEAVHWARKAGFHNISLDLMFGLPGQSEAQLCASMEELLQLAPTHLSVYDLQIEEGALFGRWVREGRLEPGTEEQEAGMYELIIQLLEDRGYHQYEVSNFAQKGYESQHNLVYWRDQPYYGVGTGAHGYLDGVRYANLQPLQKYIKALQMNPAQLPLAETHQVTITEAMEETMFLGLRMKEGVSLPSFAERFQRSIWEIYADPIRELQEQGLIVLENEHLRCTPRGMMLGNEVYMRFLLTS